MPVHVQLEGGVLTSLLGEWSENACRNEDMQFHLKGRRRYPSVASQRTPRRCTPPAANSCSARPPAVPLPAATWTLIRGRSNPSMAATMSMWAITESHCPVSDSPEDHRMGTGRQVPGTTARGGNMMWQFDWWQQRPAAKGIKEFPLPAVLIWARQLCIGDKLTH